MNTGSFIGLNNLVYAIMTQDDQYGAAYNAPIAVPGIINAKVDPKTSSDVQYYDDGPGDTQTVIGSVDVEIEVNQLPMSALRDLLGQTLVNGVLVGKSNDSAPYVAIGFKTPVISGGNQYVWLYKGKFEIPGQEHASQTDKAGMKTRKIKGTFVRRIFDKAYRVIGDDNEAGFTAGATWFTTVYMPTPDTTPPTVTTTPANNATAVSVSAAITGVFNENVQTLDVNSNTIRVMKQTDGSIVPGTMAFNSATRTFTFTPTSNLTAATPYLVSIGCVRDMAGNVIVPVTTKFTTA